MPVAGTLKHENRIVGVDESSIIGVSCAYRHVKITGTYGTLLPLSDAATRSSRPLECLPAADAHSADTELAVGEHGAKCGRVSIPSANCRAIGGLRTPEDCFALWKSAAWSTPHAYRSIPIRRNQSRPVLSHQDIAHDPSVPGQCESLLVSRQIPDLHGVVARCATGKHRFSIRRERETNTGRLQVRRVDYQGRTASCSRERYRNTDWRQPGPFRPVSRQHSTYRSHTPRRIRNPASGWRHPKRRPFRTNSPKPVSSHRHGKTTNKSEHHRRPVRKSAPLLLRLHIDIAPTLSPIASNVLPGANASEETSLWLARITWISASFSAFQSFTLPAMSPVAATPVQISRHTR